MSVTFTPVQSWIALALFVVVIIFIVYIFLLIIGLNQRQEERDILADKRSINATIERQATLAQTAELQQGQANTTKNIDELLTNNAGLQETIKFFLQRHDATIKDLIIADIKIHNATLAKELEKPLQSLSGSDLRLGQIK